MTSYIPEWPNKNIKSNNNSDLSDEHISTIDNIKGR